MSISVQENVFSEENVSVDIQKIKHIQRITGNQYLMKRRFKIILTFTPFGQTDFLISKGLCRWIRCERLYHVSEYFLAKDGSIKQIFRPELAELFERFLPILCNGCRVLTTLNGL